MEKTKRLTEIAQRMRQISKEMNVLLIASSVATTEEEYLSIKQKADVLMFESKRLYTESAMLVTDQIN